MSRHRLEKKIEVRVMGYHSWNEQFGRRAVLQPATLKRLSHKDKKPVNFVEHKRHGLTYQPRYQERVYEQDQAHIVLPRLYNNNNNNNNNNNTKAS